MLVSAPWLPDRPLMSMAPCASIGLTMSGQTPISGYVLTAPATALETPTWTSAGTVSGWTVSGNNVYETLSGNVGIGTSALQTALAVTNGNVGIGTWTAAGGSLIIRGSGNVGIGSAWPGTALDINGTARMTGFTLSNNGASQGNVLVTNAVGVGTWMPASTLPGTGTAPGGGQGAIQYNNAAAFSGDATKFAFDGTNIGIGTSGPHNKLDVLGNVGIGTIANSLYLTTPAPNGGMLIEGNVGIGSLSPGQLLDVRGTVRTTALAMSGQTPISGYVLTASDSAGDTTWTSAGAVSGWTVSGNNVYETLNGNVGIGTSALQTALAVTNGNVGIGTWTAAGGSLIVASGNVGIGSAWPGAALDVQGTMRGLSGLELGGSVANGTNSSALGFVDWRGNTYFFKQRLFGWRYSRWSGTITSSNLGSVAFGRNHLGTISATGIGAVALGDTDAGTILASNAGSFAMGYANGGTILASAQGSVVMGLEIAGLLQATGSAKCCYRSKCPAGNWNNNALAFGLSVVNPNSSSFMVGFTTTPTLTVTGTGVGIGTSSPFGGGLIVLPAATGNVGIGSLTPGQALDVQGTVRTTALAMTGQTPISGYVLTASDSAGDTTWTSAGAVSGWTVSGNNVYETLNGNVGIGTSALQTALAITNGNVGIGTWTAAGGSLIIKGSGNVGIGSAWPGTSLDINGTARMTGLTLSNNGAANGFVLVSNSVGVGTWMSATTLVTSSQWITDNSNDVYLPNRGNVGLGTFLTSTSALSVMNGNVGIGTWAPSALLTVNGNSILGTLSSNVDSIISSGTGSLAGGEAQDGGGKLGNITASSNGSLAFGYASGFFINSNIIANNTGSVALGASLSGTFQSTGQGSIAMGYVNQGTLLSTGQGSAAMGYVFGGTFQSTGNGSMTMGYESNGTLQATNIGSVAMGYASNPSTLQSTGVASVAMGQNVQAIANNAFALGLSVVNPNASSFMVGFNPTPTLTVTGTGVGIGTSSPFGGGLIVLPATTGNVGIGSLTPGQALDVNGTVRTTALAMTGQTPISGYVLTASDSAGDTTWTSGGVVSGWTVSGNNVYETFGGNVGIGTSALQTALAVTNGNVGIGTWTAAGGSLIIRGNGNVGIGSAWPGTALDINGTTRMTGFTLSNNNAANGNVLVTNSLGVGTWMPASTLAVNGTNFWLNTTAAGNVGVSTTNTVGIGTTAAGVGTGLTVMNGNVGIGTWAPAGSLVVMGGNVGIGSVQPGTLLDVQGTSRFLQGIEQGGAVASGTNAVAFGNVSTGTMTSSGIGSLVFGHTSGNLPSITSTGNGSSAGGSSLSIGANATITSSGGIAYGSVVSFPGETATITSSSASNSSIAMGFAEGIAGHVASITSSQDGTIAMGDAVGGTILSSISGSIAMGYAGSGEKLFTGNGTRSSSYGRSCTSHSKQFSCLWS